MVDINKLRTLDQLKGKVKEIFSDKEITQMAEQGMIPHFILKHPLTGSETFLFSQSDVNDWLAENCLIHRDARFEQQLKILYFDYDYYKIEGTEQVPPELSCIKGLYILPMAAVTTPPGVYFLCKEGQVVYIGSSNNIAQRIINHLTEGVKDFDKIYFIPCHIDNLLKFEHSLMRCLRPAYNTQPLSATSELDWELLRSLKREQMAEK